MQVPPRQASDGCYPEAFLRESRSHDLHEISPLGLPEIAWRTTRHPDKNVTKVYQGPPGRNRDKFVRITRCPDGDLLRHESVRYRRRLLDGELVDACLTPTGNELATLVRFGDAGSGPILRLQLLKMQRKDMETWHARRSIRMRPSPTKAYRQDALPSNCCR